MSENSARSGGLRRRPIELRLHEHEARLILEPLLLGLKQPLSKRVVIVGEQPRRQQNQHDHDQVDDDREEDALAPRDDAPDRRGVGPVVLEIKIHQELISSISGED